MKDTTRRPTRFHLSLRVAPVHLSAMVDFYTTLFGEPPRKRYLDHVQFDLLEPALEAARSRVRAAGLTPPEEPDVDCCYARQNKFWLSDPEGREVEVFHRLADLEVHGHGAAQVPVTVGAAPAVGGASAACCAPGPGAPT